MDFLITILEQGLIYGILGLGVYITYKILDFPDLTADGSFPLGAAVTAALIGNGGKSLPDPSGSFLCRRSCGSVYRTYSRKRKSERSSLRNYYDDSPLDD